MAGSNRIIANNSSVTVERRTHERLGEPTLTVHLDGTTYETSDWSLGGMCIRGYDGFRPLMAVVKIGAMGQRGRASREVDVHARVVRLDDQRGSLSLSFLVLDQLASKMLCHMENSINTPPHAAH